MTFAATVVKFKLIMDDKILEQLMRVSYLGIMVTNYGSVGKEVNC